MQYIMDLEQEYALARAKPDLRQRFLDGIDLGEYSQYIANVIRATVGSIAWEDGKILDPKTIMYNDASPMRRALGDATSPVFVLDDAFDYAPNPHDFLGYLLHHEGDHARYRFERDGRMEHWEMEEVERLAWANQLDHLDLNLNSKKYISTVKREVETRCK